MGREGERRAGRKEGREVGWAAGRRGGEEVRGHTETAGRERGGGIDGRV